MSQNKSIFSLKNLFSGSSGKPSKNLKSASKKADQIIKKLDTELNDVRQQKALFEMQIAKMQKEIIALNDYTEKLEANKEQAKQLSNTIKPVGTKPKKQTPNSKPKTVTPQAK